MPRTRRVCSYQEDGDYVCEWSIGENEEVCDKHKLMTVERFLSQINTNKTVAVYMLDGKTIGTLGEAVRQVLREIKR